MLWLIVSHHKHPKGWKVDYQWDQWVVGRIGSFSVYPLLRPPLTTSLWLNFQLPILSCWIYPFANCKTVLKIVKSKWLTWSLGWLAGVPKYWSCQSLCWPEEQQPSASNNNQRCRLFRNIQIHPPSNSTLPLHTAQTFFPASNHLLSAAFRALRWKCSAWRINDIHI